jgi:hypothetical protein
MAARAAILTARLNRIAVMFLPGLKRAPAPAGAKLAFGFDLMLMHY